VSAKPVKLVAVNGPVLERADVLALVRRRKTWLYAEIAAGRFPASDDGHWYRADIDAWIEWRRQCVRGGSDVGSWSDWIKKAA
jgi:predicted DNA-binding transcriptional regulator AlpA